MTSLHHQHAQGRITRRLDTGRVLPLFLLQPVLAKIVRRIATRNPDMFARLGPFYEADYIIDPKDLPFVLHLRPNAQAPVLRACARSNQPAFTARITGRFLDLLQLVDADIDGDALFFSRELKIEGNTEAVVCLRNALDDIDGSIAQEVAEMFGQAGRVALNACRRAGDRSREGKDQK